MRARRLKQFNWFNDLYLLADDQGDIRQWVLGNASSDPPTLTEDEEAKVAGILAELTPVLDAALARLHPQASWRSLIVTNRRGKKALDIVIDIPKGLVESDTLDLS